MALDLKQEVQRRLDRREPICLHLGCGPVILDDWINVDGEYMSHHASIAIHDIGKPYPIDDGVVDEILLVHVIEHIMPYEVPGMMQEWLRILKPGGRVALEWPDLLKMCTAIVNDPSCLWSDDPKVRKATIAGIFGNIDRYRDVAMLHKWGYSAESMCHLLAKMGFVDVRIEPNRFRKSKADSRVVGRR